MCPLEKSTCKIEGGRGGAEEAGPRIPLQVACHRTDRRGTETPIPEVLFLAPARLFHYLPFLVPLEEP